MTSPKPDQMEISSPMFSKSNRVGHSLEAKGISFFACVFSVFFCSSIFYIFNISPSHQLFSNTKFWFFVSNTLIIIIAADYGAFSTSKKKRRQQDLYQEFVMHTKLKYNAVSGFVARYPEPEKEVGGDDTEDELGEENKLEIIPLLQQDHTAVIPTEKNMEVDPSEISKEHSHEVSQDMAPYLTNEPCQEKHVVNEETNKENVVYEGEHDKDVAMVEADDDEFSRMSDEELNKRVEEFILKLKRQIRLQGNRDFGLIVN